MAHQQFSPPGNLQQFFITRRDNVSACSVLLPPPHPVVLPRPNSRKSVVPLPVLRHGWAPHFAGHDNVFIIHRIIRDTLAEIRWDGIMCYYRLYQIGDLSACGSKKVIGPTFRQVALISTWGRKMGNNLFLRDTCNCEIVWLMITTSKCYPRRESIICNFN